MALSKVAIWVKDANPWDRMVLPVCDVSVIDSRPVKVVPMRLGRPKRVRPTGTDKAAWAVQVVLTFSRRYVYLLNEGDSGYDSRRFFEWLRYYKRDGDVEFILFVQAIGTDSGGSGVDDGQYYLARIDTVPPELMGYAASAGAAPRKATLTFTIPEQASSEGSFADFDTNPLSMAGLTPRTVS